AAPMLVIGLTLVHAVFWTDLRMRAPIVPAIALIAAAAHLPRGRLPRVEAGDDPKSPGHPPACPDDRTPADGNPADLGPVRSAGLPRPTPPRPPKPTRSPGWARVSRPRRTADRRSPETADLTFLTSSSPTLPSYLALAAQLLSRP